MSATSYPRDRQDWQGVFIRHIAEALAADPAVALSLWAPDGPRSDAIGYCCNEDDRAWLDQLSGSGGIAHLLRRQPLLGLWRGVQLLQKLRRSYQRHAQDTDLFHINWLQNALALGDTRQPAVITVLGSDFKLLGLPGMKPALRRILSQRQCVLAPNAEWMIPTLEQAFGDLCAVRAVPFGIDPHWYALTRQPQALPRIWIVVVRVTADKIGALFDWGESLFAAGSNDQLHLIGPNQDQLTIPDWVHYHGPQSQQQLLQHWFPRAAGMITLSQHSEGRPQVMLEAMAAGLPIIASAIPAHRSFITDNVNGMLVGSDSEFRGALNQLAEPAVNRRIGAAARNFANDHYGTWQDCAQRYMKLYRQLLETVVVSETGQ